MHALLLSHPRRERKKKEQNTIPPKQNVEQLQTGRTVGWKLIGQCHGNPHVGLVTLEPRGKIYGASRQLDGQEKNHPVKDAHFPECLVVFTEEAAAKFTALDRRCVRHVVLVDDLVGAIA